MLSPKDPGVNQKAPDVFKVKFTTTKGAFVIEVPGFRAVEAVGWVLWRRKEVCTVKRPSGAPVTLGPGFGVVFEWISLESRIEIARRVALLA